jgi:hypothetical protein
VYEAADRFLSEVGRWAADCRGTYQAKPPTNVHDQLTYTTGWEPWIVHTQDAATIAFLKTARDQVASHLSRNGMWRHGYWKEQEAHHGRDHGCSARSVSAIARGHGCDNNAGVTTAVLAPLLKVWTKGDR